MLFFLHYFKENYYNNETVTHVIENKENILKKIDNYYGVFDKDFKALYKKLSKTFDIYQFVLSMLRCGTLGAEAVPSSGHLSEQNVSDPAIESGLAGLAIVEVKR